MDKMREEFEAWCASIGFTLGPNAFDNGDYAMGYGWEEWNAWKASRATLRVELPGAWRLAEHEYKRQVEESLDSAGVSHE